jgi:glycyl-tRNA synthetase
MADLMEKIVALCKRRGFVYSGSEIYGGLANTWDYGPLGVELKNNIKEDWWETFVQKRDDIFGLDGGILLNPQIWETSGHTTGFIDVLVECKSCHKRFRVDFLEGATKCPECGGQFTKPKKFVPMFKTFIGPVEKDATVAYLRPETAQAIFVNFKNILDSHHPELPFGIAQMGKAFRNEITLGNFIFRTLEFEQMEIEHFVLQKEWEKYFEEWKKLMGKWVVDLGVAKKNLRWRPHGKDELSHYSERTEDLEYKFPFGFKELYGLAYRTDFDLRQHAEKSGVDLTYQDQETGKKFYPHVVEPSFGLERTFLVILLDAYKEEKDRVVLRLSAKIAPYKVAVFPLLANKPKLVKKARKIYQELKKSFPVAWDERGNIGKRYYAQDEIGTPWCVTIDFETLKDDTVTVRDRDTTKQKRVGVDKLTDWFQNNLTK